MFSTSLQFFCKSFESFYTPWSNQWNGWATQPWRMTSVLVNQVIFYWAQVTQTVCCWFDAHPHMRPSLPPGSGSEHRISLSKAQQEQVVGSECALHRRACRG